MIFRLAADAVLVVHLMFILFVLLGALLVARWRWVLAAHLPSAAWGCFVELTGRICPLTYLENHLRMMAGQSGYAGGFIEQYLLPLIYPGFLTRSMQIGLAGVVLAINLAIYGALFRARRGPGREPRLRDRHR